MWSAIRENSSWQGEIWNRRKNGDIYPEWLSISTVKDERGQVSHYLGVFSDISAMKESESRLDYPAHHDPLTGLPNRLLLSARMEHSLARARRNHSQLAVLFIKRFPIDRIKIDQSFVRNITSDPEDAAVSQAIISLSHSLNLKTIAEGVETPEQQEFLRSRNCDEIQGFHFSRPVPHQEMHRMLREGCGIAARPSVADPEERVLLLVDDEQNILEALARVLRPEGYRILRALRPRDALDLLATHPVGVIVSDLRMLEMNGIDLLRKVRKLHPQTVRILLTAYADKKMLADAINEGAVYKFVAKPWEDEALRQLLRDAFQHHEALLRLHREVVENNP